MALDIGFGNHINTVLIAKVIPTGIIGVVAGAHGVHVQLLHDFDVLNHAFHADEVTAVGVQFVAVGTFDEDGLTVDEDLSVLDFDTAETNALADGFECVAFLVLEGEGGGIEVRNLSRPRFDGGNGQGECRGLRAEGCLSAAGCATGRVGQGEVYDVALSSRSRDGGCQLTILITIDDILKDEDILDVGLRTCIEVHLAGNTCETPEVLILEVRAVAPAHDLHGDEVFLAGGEEFGQVEFGFHLGVFAIADFLAVDPYLQVRCSRTYVKIDVLSLPRSGNGNELAVRARVIVAFLDERRIRVELGVPGISYVFVDLVAIAVELE